MPSLTFTPGEAERTAYWQQQMELSHELLSAMKRYPCEECGEGFAAIADAASEAGVEMFFSDTGLAGRFERVFYIREGIIGDLISAGREMNERGWMLKIEDGYRTREMQEHLGRQPAVFDRIVDICCRESGGPPPIDLVARRATCLVANYPLTGTHLSGAAVDVSVYRRDDGTEVDRGCAYLHMSELTPMLSPFVSTVSRLNRIAITEIMERHGFVHYPGEFWHYNKGDSLYQMQTGSGRPGRYGPVHWDPVSNRVTPFEDMHSPIIDIESLESELRAALHRLACGLEKVNQ